MDKVTFEAGDVVTCVFYGDEEFVLSREDGGSFPINFKRYGRDITFTLDGRYSISHTTPVLKLVRKHKKDNELVTVYTIRVHMIGRYREEFDTYEKAVEWIKTNGNSKMDYKIDKIYRIKE